MGPAQEENMISYAISMACCGKVMTRELANAFRKSKLRNVEITLAVYTQENEISRESEKLTLELIGEGTIHPASVHLPFCGIWDPSELNEEKRKYNIACFSRLIQEHSGLLGEHMTLHASAEPPLAEHPARIDQVCRSLEDLMPLAERFGFSINMEFLPRTCVGNSVDELQRIMRRFDAKHVGICLDVNHIMNRAEELPAIIHELAPRIRSFHINDYDNVDEVHWLAGQGCIDWVGVMKEIRAIPEDVLLIHETVWQLQSQDHKVDPVWQLRQIETACWFLENCNTVMPSIRDFKIPGNI